MASPEINKVLYPTQYDSQQNWPATTTITQSTGEDINRNRDAILVLERLLGLNPQQGLFTKNLSTCTVAERLNTLEQGIASGQFAFQTLRVTRAIIAAPDPTGLMRLVLGTSNIPTQFAATPVDIRGPLHVYNSGIADPRAIFDVGFLVSTPAGTTTVPGTSPNCIIVGTSQANQPLLTIQDYALDPVNDPNHVALNIIGNVNILGHLTAQYSIDHDTLLGINTTPAIDSNGNIVQQAVHVARGDYHSHKRGIYNTSLQRWMVDPNPAVDTFGLIDHSDLEPASTRTHNTQTNFIPDTTIAYHVTNGDDHDHVGGDGATLKHKFLSGIDPSVSNHVTGGDSHSHNPTLGDGAPIETMSTILDPGLAATFTAIEVADKASLTTTLTEIDSILTANGSAISAQTNALAIAEAAESAAATAQTIAQTSSTNSTNAVNTANSAVTTATTAEGLATTANTNASAAQTAVTALQMKVVTTMTTSGSITRLGPRMYVGTDSTAGIMTVTVYGSPTAGDQIIFKDETGQSGANNVTIGATIDGSVNLLMHSNYIGYTITYANGGWRLTGVS